ncbi:helix-turn-helix domain-containing protein [Fusobacterium varium]
MEDIWNYLISLKDAAELYGLEESTLRRAISRGLLIENEDCKKFGKQWVLKKSSLDKIKDIKSRKKY